jgi:ferric-dicitrate binding protein FerR (iron transport regulator)
MAERRRVVTRIEELEALGRHVAKQEEALGLSPAEHERLRAAVVERAFAARPHAGFRARRWAAGMAAAALALGVASLLFIERAPEPLSFFVGSREEPGTVGSWMSAPEASPFPVRFSDGTRASLLPMGRARVVNVSPFGANVVVESGRAQFDVVPRPNGEWRVNTGPFVVHVTGTRFEVEWHPDRDTFALELHEGQVSISGCNLDDPYPIRAGQRVEASCGRREFHVAPIERPTASAAAGRAGSAASEARPAPETSAAPGPTATESGASAAATKQVEPSATRPLAAAKDAHRPSAHDAPATEAPSNADFEDRWVDLAKRGLYADAFAAAEERGFDKERERRGAAEVLLLGDAARFSGHADKARLAYQAIRQRFPATPSAALAAFQLGRDDFDRRSDYAGAERWLRVYLEEAPGGALAPPAMGRLMEAELRQGNQAEAQKLAEAYLARFPKGPHAEAARRVAGAAAGDVHR